MKKYKTQTGVTYTSSMMVNKKEKGGPIPPALCIICRSAIHSDGFCQECGREIVKDYIYGEY